MSIMGVCGCVCLYHLFIDIVMLMLFLSVCTQTGVVPYCHCTQ